MSKTTKKRFVMKRIDTEFVLPAEKDLIARVISSRGRDLLEVEDQNGETYLVSMPTRFRNTVWVKRGQYVYVQPIEEGDKVKAEIQHVLDNDTIIYVDEQGKWPEHFSADVHKLRPKTNAPTIDEDMLPPSESEDSEADEEISGESADEREEIDRSVFNPNRAAAP